MHRSEFTIVTLNIFHDLPAYRHLERRLELIAEAIAARRPHIVALQEVLRATSAGDIGAKIRDRVNQLCGGEPYGLDYVAADGAGEGEFSFDEGLALLSRVAPAGPAKTLKYAAQVELTTEVAGHRYRLPDDRVALRRRFRLENGAGADVIVSHLTDRPETIGRAAVRTMQAGELAAWATAEDDLNSTLILAGDFNDVPGSDTIAQLSRASFVDLHEAFGSGPGYTNDRDDIELNAEHASHNQRIDYLMMRAGGGRAPEVSEVALFADRPHRQSDGTWLWASDHIGVIATLRL